MESSGKYNWASPEGGQSGKTSNRQQPGSSRTSQDLRTTASRDVRVPLEGAAYVKHSHLGRVTPNTSSRGSIPTPSTQLAMTYKTDVNGFCGGSSGCVVRIPVHVLDGIVTNPYMDNVISLPGYINLELQRQLEPEKKWRKLVTVTDNTHFKLDVVGIHEVENAQVPTRNLLLRYSVLGMKVQTLVELLSQAKLYNALTCLRKPELLQITCHPPPHVTVEEGKLLTLRCEADGFPEPNFQWYHHRDNVTVKVPHQTSSVLNITQFRKDQEGSYVCQVNNASQMNFPHSTWCKVNVLPAVSRPINDPPKYRDIPFRPPTAVNKAQAKVALLVGTATYHTACQSLPAARNDVQALEECLERMNFMVVTLLDLSKDELIKHVQWFCELLDEGVYGVFFYIGHGFNHCHQSFLIPWDAEVGYGTEHCVYLEKHILRPILLRNPAMCLAIIDVCRIKSPQILADDHPEETERPVNGTTCIFYATSPGTSSYEDSYTRQGIFMTHLLKVIGEKVSVQELHTMVLNEIKRDPMAGDKQYPNIDSNLNSNLSLHDPIDSKGHTKAMNRRRALWESSTQLPPNVIIPLEKFAFKVMITFTKQFSNHLSMSVRVWKRGNVSSCKFKVSNDPPEITVKVNNQSDSGIDVQFLGLQRLQKPLQPLLHIDLLVGGVLHRHCEQLELGEPLVSMLHLHAPLPGNTIPSGAEHRGATE